MRHSMGSGGFCICPKCGTKAQHQPGTPCLKTACPKCGAKMLREGSEHHELLKQKREERK